MAGDGGFHIEPGKGGDGGGSGGSSGGSSGGGSSSPPPDPFFQDKVKAQKYAMFQGVYNSLWGEPATEDYLKKVVNAGLNRWEFEEGERQKPAFRRTETYRDQGSSLAELLGQLGVTAPAFGGRRGGGGGKDGGKKKNNERQLPSGGPRGA